MTELQKVRLLLRDAMNGRFIPHPLIFEMIVSLGRKNYDCFYEIYSDKNLNVLLVSNALTREQYLTFWKEIFPEQAEPEEKVITYLLSEDFVKAKILWLDIVSYLALVMAECTLYSELEILVKALYYHSCDADKAQWFAQMIKRLEAKEYSYDVYLAYCVIIREYELMTMELLPDFLKAFEKHKQFFLKG